MYIKNRKLIKGYYCNMITNYLFSILNLAISKVLLSFSIPMNFLFRFNAAIVVISIIIKIKIRILLVYGQLLHYYIRN